MKSIYRPRFLWPAVFLVLGTIMLLHTMHLLPYGLWYKILKLWPALLIAVGLDMLLGRRTRWRVALTLSLAALAVGAVLAGEALQ